MNALTPEQQLIKAAVLEELKKWLQQQHPLHPLLLKSRQVKSMLKVSRTTLSTLRKKGALPAVLVGNNYRYKYGDVLKYLEGKNLSFRTPRSSNQNK